MGILQGHPHKLVGASPINSWESLVTDMTDIENHIYKSFYCHCEFGGKTTMNKNIETKMEEFMKPLFGDMAQKTIDNQKAKLELGEDINQEDYVAVAESIRDLCRKMAGNAIADKIYAGLVKILEDESN